MLKQIHRGSAIAVTIATVVFLYFAIVGVFGLKFAIAGALFAALLSIWVFVRAHARGDQN